jgi:epoxyqueuosine reductase QueG
MPESASQLTLPSRCSATETRDMCPTQAVLQNQQEDIPAFLELVINKEYSILQTACILITQYIKLCNLCQIQLDKAKQNTAFDCMRVIHSNIETIEN